MTISHFPLPPARAIDLIRDAANSKNTIIPDRLADGEWPNKVFHRQVMRCLEDGTIINGPDTNEYGHFEYKMKRVSAGQEIYLTAVLFKEENTWIVAVKEVKSGEY